MSSPGSSPSPQPRTPPRSPFDRFVLLFKILLELCQKFSYDSHQMITFYIQVTWPFLELTEYTIHKFSLSLEFSHPLLVLLYSPLNLRNQSSRVSLGRGRVRRTPPGQRRPCPPSPLARNPSSPSPSAAARPLSSPFPTHPAGSSSQPTRLSPRGHPPSRGPGAGGRPGQRVSTLRLIFSEHVFSCQNYMWKAFIITEIKKHAVPNKQIQNVHIYR